MEKEYKVSLYVDFLNADIGHKPDRKYFKGNDYQEVYNEAVKWCKDTMGKFHPDYIKTEYWD